MNRLRTCPECGKVIGYNSYFSAFICESCGYELVLPRLVQRDGDDMKRVCHLIKEQDDMGCYGCEKRGACNYNLFDKLSAYEDAEENGYLIRFPCKPGDTVFYINYCFNKIGKGIVTDVKYYHKYNKFVIEGECEDGESFVVSTVYRTLKGAEKALSESQGAKKKT